MENLIELIRIGLFVLFFVTLHLPERTKKENKISILIYLSTF